MADKPTGLDWVKLREDMDRLTPRESGWQKLVRKLKENPLVPFGKYINISVLKYVQELGKIKSVSSSQNYYSF